MGTPESRFRQICSELGWGDAESGLWFVGVEEGHGWIPGDETRIERLYNHHEYFRNDDVEKKTRPPDEVPKSVRSQIEPVESRIAAPLSVSISDPKKYRDFLWTDGSRVAHANLYPLGKPHVGALPAHYANLFGFGRGRSESERYEEAVAEFRFPRLRQAVKKLRPLALVCMGKGL